MRLLCIILSLSVLFAGCYTATPLTKDTPPPPPTVEVTFRLKDGTHILSHEYQRVDNGYRIVGKLNSNQGWNIRDFDGIVYDGRIQEVVIVEFDSGKTVVAVALGVVLVAGIAAMIFGLSFSLKPIK